MNKKPLIISTDPGIDDAVALTISLFAKELDVKLIAATWGNVTLEKTLNNTLKLETFLGTKVPVVSGAKLPLVKKPIDASEVHGKSGMDGFDFPEPDKGLLVSGLAATKIHEVVANSSEKVTLMQIGPATDFALYFRQYPDDLEKINELVIMGGAIGRGNYGPYDEYNVSGDPEAAKIVFESGVKIRVAPLELGHQAFVKQDTMDIVRNYGKNGDMLYSILSNLHDGTLTDGLEIYDALAVGMLLAPDMYTFKPAFVAIDTNDSYTYGASVMDFDNFFGKPANAEIGVAIDREQFVSWFAKVLKEADK